VSAVRPLLQATLALKARHAALDLHVSAAKSLELLDGVAAGELDAAIVVREAGAKRGELLWSPLHAEPLVLVTPRSVPEDAPRGILQAHPFLRFDRTQHTGRMIERTLRRLRARPQEFLELNTLEAIIDLVRSGLGVTIVPLLRDGRWQSDPKLRVLAIPGAEERRIALVQRRDSAKAELLAAVVREVRAQATH